MIKKLTTYLLVAISLVTASYSMDSERSDPYAGFKRQVEIDRLEQLDRADELYIERSKIVLEIKKRIKSSLDEINHNYFSEIIPKIIHNNSSLPRKELENLVNLSLMDRHDLCRKKAEALIQEMVSQRVITAEEMYVAFDKWGTHYNWNADTEELMEFDTDDKTRKIRDTLEKLRK